MQSGQGLQSPVGHLPNPLNTLRLDEIFVKASIAEKRRKRKEKCLTKTITTSEGEVFPLYCVTSVIFSLDSALKIEIDYS